MTTAMAHQLKRSNSDDMDIIDRTEIPCPSTVPYALGESVDWGFDFQPFKRFRG